MPVSKGLSASQKGKRRTGRDILAGRLRPKPGPRDTCITSKRRPMMLAHNGLVPPKSRLHSHSDVPMVKNNPTVKLIKTPLFLLVRRKGKSSRPLPTIHTLEFNELEKTTPHPAKKKC